MSSPARPAREGIAIISLFLLALAGHFYLATGNWHSSFLPGHEFRQSQTAIVSHYIDKEDNFSLYYETPIVGKPWVSILLEVPFYQWGVVGLSRLTGWPHHIAARTISLASFYVALPAMYLLLGRLQVPPIRRLLVLVPVLLCPVYIFYSRAFLMDPTMLALSAWFLLGFVRTMDQRHRGWLLLTMVTAAVAALMKIVFLAVWMLPAAAYGAWLLWRDWRSRGDWKRLVGTAAWGVATVAPGMVALWLWTRAADAVKEVHASAHIFTSKAVSLQNWGTFDPRAAFAPSTWGTLLERWREAMLPPWLLLAALLLGFVVPGRRGKVLACAAVFFLAQLLFPYAYAYQDYYYYAPAAFAMAAIGLGLTALLDTRLPRWLVLFAVLAVPAGGVWTYWQAYREHQMVRISGGYPFTEIIKDMLPRKSVIVVAGADWAAMVPLYSERRALMVRNGLEFDPAYQRRAYADLADEDVAALVVLSEVRTNRAFIELAAQTFDLDATTPTYRHPAADVYVRRIYAPTVQSRLRGSRKYGEITIPGDPAPWSGEPFSISPTMARAAFERVHPGPVRGRFEFGIDLNYVDDSTWLSAHPDCDLWIPAPAQASQILWEFGFLPDAFERSGDRTDGVVFAVTAELPDGSSRKIYQRVLDPVRNPVDRGRITEVIPYQPIDGEILHFTSRPNIHKSYDWVHWSRIEVR